LHARDTRGVAFPKKDPIMSQHDELPIATAMANNALAANTARHLDWLMPSNSSMSQEVRL
jgi:hypothetical protein